MNIDTDDLKKFIFDKVKGVPTTRIFNYTIFGKEIEDYITDALEEYFVDKPGYVKHKVAPDKNYFPDFELNDNIALEIKAGRNEANPENDMGTLNSWEKKLSKFNDNIYYIFVKYGCDENGAVNFIDDIYIDKVYKFIGKNGADVLKYREKDGNLRPKSWTDFKDNNVYVDDFEDFKSKLAETNLYRAYRIAAKKINDIKDNKRYMKRLYDNFFKDVDKN